MIYDVNDKNYKEFISLNNDKVIILDFYTNRCGFCKLEDLIFDSLSSQINHDEIVLAKVDCDLSINLVNQYLIQSLPTIIILKDDVIIAKLPGISNEGKILNYIKK